MEAFEYNNELSFKNFVNKIVSNLSFSDKVIYSSSFYHETPDVHTFPEGMTGVTFINCNLDNCYIPEGNTLVNCSTRRFMANPEDGHDWEVDENLNFIKPIN
jgi:hypothetical protein